MRRDGRSTSFEMETEMIANGNADKQLKGREEKSWNISSEMPIYLPTGSRKIDFNIYFLPANIQINSSEIRM